MSQSEASLIIPDCLKDMQSIHRSVSMVLTFEFSNLLFLLTFGKTLQSFMNESCRTQQTLANFRCILEAVVYILVLFFIFSFLL